MISQGLKSAGENDFKITSIGRKIASLRTILHFSQEDFSILLCLDSRSSIIKMEAAKEVSALSLDLQFRLYTFLRMLTDEQIDPFISILANNLLEEISQNINLVIKNKLSNKLTAKGF